MAPGLVRRDATAQERGRLVRALAAERHARMSRSRCGSACAFFSFLRLILWMLPCGACLADLSGPGITNAIVLSIENKVEVGRYGSQVWDPAYVQPASQVLNPGDRLRTGRD